LAPPGFEQALEGIRDMFHDCALSLTLEVGADILPWPARFGNRNTFDGASAWKYALKTR
jgi:hypothetical protein